MNRTGLTTSMPQRKGCALSCADTAIRLSPKSRTGTKSLLVEWIDPKAIRFKISPHHDLSGTTDGDWDLDRRHPLEQSAKYRSIIEHYRDGKPWEDTDLFRDLYRRRIESGDSVRGERTMKGLLAQYGGRVDGLFQAMRRDGFQSKASRLPRLLIGRDGEVFIGNQGNHRLAMAHVLGLEKIAGEIICRHPLAT
jgi:hypothetical protein